MKKIFIYLPILLSLTWACEPMEDIYNEIDDKKDAYNEKVDAVLVEADYKIAKSAALILSENASDSAYAKAIESDMAFNERFTGNEFIPFILEELYKALDETSTANVTYNTNFGKPESLIALTTAPFYEITSDDYELVGADEGYFTSSNMPEANIPAVLSERYKNAIDGDKVLTNYLYIETAGLTAKTHFEYDFSDYADRDSIDNKDGWQQVLTKGSRGWVAREFSSNLYAQYSSYKSEEENEAYLITPAIDVPGSSRNQLSFDVNVGYWTHEGLNVFISNDYDGSDFASATWTDITSGFIIPTEPTDGYGTFATAGTVEISEYTGTIYIAFKYTGDGNDGKTTTYQVDNVEVKEIVESEAVPVSLNAFYELNADTWEAIEATYSLNENDYDEMGAPGAYNNFSDNASPENYLPQFLTLKYPYAQDGELLAISYDYYDGETTSRLADEYTLNAGVWSKQSYIVEKTEQFVHTGETGWIFDPTIRTKLDAAEYQLIVDYVKNNISSGYIDSYGTGEFYHGANSYYRNFDLRLIKREEFKVEGFDGLTQDEGIALTWQRVEDALKIYLQEAYPEAKPDVNGVIVYYWLTFYTYENDLAKNNYTGIFRLSESEGFIRDHEKEDDAVANGELTEDEINWNKTE